MTNEELAMSCCVALGKDVVRMIESARQEEREECARILLEYSKTNEDGEWVTPKLGYWRGGDYIPDAEAIAAKFRQPK